jgi:hypothetical protein
MVYKGNDLDLRTPGVASGPRGPGVGETAPGYVNGSRPARPTSASGPTATTSPVYVDDTVVECCNHAFNMALFNSAAEVRLEHLVHALTRVEAASRVLEQRGVREAQLRIESATAIASQIPVGLPEGQSQPRTSVAFDELLRRASDRAQRYGRAAAGVDDLLQVLVGMRPDLPGVALFLRHAEDLRPQEPEPLPPRELSRALPPEPREQAPRFETAALDTVLQRVDGLASMIRSLQSDVEAERRRGGDLAGLVQQEMHGLRASVHEAVEQRSDEMMRAFETRLTLDRRALGDLIADTQRELAGLRNQGASQRTRLDDRSLALLDGVQNGLTQHRSQVETHVGAVEARLADRLQVLERHLERLGAGNYAELSRATLPLQDRLAAIERALAERADPADRVAERLEAIEIRLAGVDRAVESRLAALDRMAQATGEAMERTLLQITRAGENISAGAANAASAAASGAFERVKSDVELALAQFTRTGESISAGAANAASTAATGAMEQVRVEFAGRLERLERAVTANGRADDGARWSALDDRLQLVGRSVGMVSAETTRIASLIAERDPTPVLDRLRVLENVLAAHRSEHGELRTAITGGLKAVERAQVESQGTGAALEATFAERLQSLARTLDALRGDLDRTIGQGFTQGFASIEAGLASERSEKSRATALLEGMTERVHTLEGMLVAASQRQLEVVQAQEVSLTEVSDGLVKLGNNQQTLSVNQQTLAQSLDEWRQERAGDLSIIDNQLRQLTVEVQEPRRAIDMLSDSMRSLQRIVLEQSRPRSWFKNWLFGTDTVWEAGWGNRDEARQGPPPVSRA